MVRARSVHSVFTSVMAYASHIGLTSGVLEEAEGVQVLNLVVYQLRLGCLQALTTGLFVVKMTLGKQQYARHILQELGGPQHQPKHSSIRHQLSTQPADIN